MNQLAICIPTYNQPDMMQEMMIRCLPVYREFEIDIYVYDSSPGRETEEILHQYQAEYKNLHYRRLPADIHSNRKVLNAYREIISLGKYEYLWLCPDYIQLTRPGTECVLSACSKGYDICVLNYRDVEHVGEKVYTDVNAFFLDCAWHMSSYMATVIRLSSFEDMEWEPFYERYTTPERINHSHVAFYFEQLAKLPRATAVHIPISSVHMRVSSYRKESLWKRDIFPIWCEYWPDMIDALPRKYVFKKEAVKKLGVNTGLFGWKNFIGLREEKIYDRKVYRRYRKEWKNLTKIPPVCLGLLAVMPVSLAGLFVHPGWRRCVLNRRLRRFSKKQEEIFIYGCGFMGEKTSRLLEELHIEYQGYVVSDSSSEKRSFHGLPVVEYGEFLQRGSQAGVILALNKKNADQVMKEKQGLSAYKIFFMHQYEDMI